jgi:hypothetical protein
VRGKIVKEKKVKRKFDDFLVVWYKWKWEERKIYLLVNDITTLILK